ncbi:MAG TPA: calcium/sodium antiporter [Candidatus Peribacterales bacterium]|nr:calcium/sodium antiporter [Candidatus Peribacterales bacterium]
MILALAMLIAGILLLIKGADWLVEGSSSLAKRFGVSDLMIGLTVVAFGTSMPELLVNIVSSVEGANDIAIGNIVGSNIANILLVLGIASIIRNVAVKTSTVWNEIPLALLAVLVLQLMANDSIIDHYPVSELSRSDGLAFLAFFLIFLWYVAKMRRREDEIENGFVERGVPVSIGFVSIGLGLLLLGGKLTVDGAIDIASLLGISQAFIGLTIVAIGTSLPELVTSVLAAVRKKADIAVGNVVGSNIFNVFWIMGVGTIIHPVRLDPALNADLFVAILATVVLFIAVHTGHVHRRIFLFWRQRQEHVIGRTDGVIMLLLYVAYLGYLVWRG